MVALVSENTEPTERLEAEVSTLAAQIAQATCRFVLLVAELDRREAWAEWGCKSMAHWLSWKCGMSIVTARTHARVGHALDRLPLMRQEFGAGRLSFSKVRTLTRVATPDREEQLVEFAKLTTAAQLDQAIRVYERTHVDADTAKAQVAARRFQMFHEDDGTVTMVVRLPRDAAENVLAAVDAALDEVPRDIDPLDPAGSRRADALELVATHFLAGRSERLPTEVVVHIDEEQVSAGEPSPVVERLLCDTSIRVVTPNRQMRRSRTIPIALRRYIGHRDKACCRFPGCTNRRFLHVHHIVHWSRNGPTNEANCVLLCPFHHRAVHEGGWRVHGDARQLGQLIFLGPLGKRMHEMPAPLSARPMQTVRGIDELTIDTALGDRMDLGFAVDALRDMLSRPYVTLGREPELQSDDHRAL